MQSDDKQESVASTGRGSSGPDGAPAIRVTGVNKVFGDRPERALPLIADGRTRDEIQADTGLVVGVRDATFEIQAGEFFVIMGLSGSGKSTMVRLLNRLLEPTSGTIEINGRDITRLSERELRRLRSTNLSMVFQHFALLPHQTVRQNAGFGLQIRGMSRRERERSADEALEMVGLGGWGDRYPSELSGGMKQRVGLARALATQADILLMDEAFSALDPLIRREMQDHLLQLQAELQKTVVFITHDLNEAMRLGDRIAVMRDGEIVQLGTSEAILTEPANDYVAAFIQDVDPTRVLTAGSIMREPIGVVSPDVGPRVAMQQLRELQRNELYAVRSDRTVEGYVRDTELLEAAQRGDATLRALVHDDFPRATADTPISDLYPLAAEHTLPIAVLDERGRLSGVVPRVSLLAAMAQLSVRGAEAAEAEARLRAQRDAELSGVDASETADTDASDADRPGDSQAVN